MSETGGRPGRIAAIRACLWLPECDAMICLQCRAVFHRRESACPACGSEDSRTVRDYVEDVQRPKRIVRKVSPAERYWDDE